jgi:hypothetical protein
MADWSQAPIQKDVDLSYNVIRFNGSLLKENVFRQDAGLEVDAAWASLGVDCKPGRPVDLYVAHRNFPQIEV